MKKQITLCLLLCLSLFGGAQSNPAKATSLANLPPECVEFYANSNEFVQYSITKVVLSDFTKKDPITRKPPLTTYSFRVDSAKFSGTAGYILQYLDAYDNTFMYTNYGWQGNSYKWFLASKVFTVTQGPFAGQTYRHPEGSLVINRNGNQYEMVRSGDMWANVNAQTDSAGYPLTSQPWMDVKTEYRYKLFLGREGLGATSTNRVFKNDMYAATGWNDAMVERFTRQVTRFNSTSTVGKLTHHACDIEVSGNTYKVVPYFNGIKFSDINYKSLITSYGKLYPGYVVRWKLFNGAKYPSDYVYGCTWVKEFKPGEGVDNSLKIVADTQFFYDAATNTLHFDNTTIEDPILWGEYEEYPAQGKNDGDQCFINLRTGKKVINAVGKIEQ
jgi:hypothetical protein